MYLYTLFEHFGASTLIIVAILTLLFVYLMYNGRQKHMSMPGPAGWPLVGNGLLLEPGKSHKTFTDLARVYGPIYQFNAYGDRIVIVSSPELIREVLVTRGEEFGGRRRSWRHGLIRGGDTKGENILLSSISPKWNILKKTCMSSLKVIGDGVEELERTVRCIINESIQEIRQQGEGYFDPSNILHLTVSNMNALLVFGKRYPAEDERALHAIDKGINTLMSQNPYGMALDRIPPVRLIPTPQLKKLKDHLAWTRDWLLTHVHDTIERFKTEEVSCAITDLMRRLAAQDTTHTESAHRLVTEDLVMVAHDLVIAGTITTTIAMTSLFAILAQQQDIQKELQDKIADVMGDREPSMKDRSSLPYVDSLVWELLRYISHVTMNIPHMTMRDTTLKGYFIPKNTMELTNLWALHHDPDLWDDPWTFKPDRFLDKQGNLVTADHKLRKQVFPFGAGRRVCAGEVMGRNRLFLLTVSFLQRFTILPGEGSRESADPRNYGTGLIAFPPPFKVKMIPRD